MRLTDTTAGPSPPAACRSAIAALSRGSVLADGHGWPLAAPRPGNPPDSPHPPPGCLASHVRRELEYAV